jgi:hypothetical protein
MYAIQNLEFGIQNAYTPVTIAENSNIVYEF